MPLAPTQWKVLLFVAHPPPKAAEHVDNFGVQAQGPDKAKAAAKKWLVEHGYTIRAISVSTTPATLVAYVFPKEATK